MAHYGLLRDYRFDDAGTGEDLRGASIYGRDDEKLGKIDDVIFDHSTGAIRYVVVDAGGWFTSKKFLVPPHKLQASAKHEDDFSVDLTKQQITAFPPYNESDVEADDNWRQYERQYTSAWHDGTVQHRHGSDHNVTPTPDEMPAEPGSIGSQLTPSERAEVNSGISTTAGNDITIEVGGTGIGSRWQNFEDRLRQRRRDITLSCTTCSAGSASDRSLDREQERKAS